MTESSDRLTALQKERKASFRSLNSSTSVSNSTKSKYYTSQLHKLCDSGSYDQIREILPNVPHSVFLERQGLHKWTPLMILCVRAPLDVIKLLIQRAPESCHIVDTSKSLPLHFVACWRRDGEEEHVLKCLLSKLRNDGKEQIEVTNQWGQNPLHAVFDSKEPPHRQLAVVKVLTGLDQISDGQDEDLYRLNRIADDQSGIVSMRSHNVDDASSAMHHYVESASRKTLETKSVSTSLQYKYPASEALSLPLEVIVKLKEKASPGVLKALSTPDSKSRLPLHIACKNGASYQVIQLLLALYPDSCVIPTQSNQYPMHLFFDYLSSPIGLKKVDLPRHKTQETMELLTKPLLSLYSNPSKRKKSRGILPIHIACELGLSHDLIAGLCQAYPKGVSKVKPGTSQYPIELFLLSKAHDRALSAKYELDTLSKEEAASPKYNHLHETLEGFHRTSDLLFAYYPEAIPSEKSGIKLFRRDMSRITRLEQLIRKEAMDKKVLELSATARLVWIWMCHFTNPDNSRDVYVSSVGRVIDNLDSSALWKLTFVKNSSTDHRTFLKVGGPSGKTVIMEAENRAARTTLYDLLHVSNNWQNLMLSYLNVKDALSYSSVCKHCFVTGVKYLTGVEELGEGRFESTSQPQPWKRLNLVIPQCTHSVEVSYRLTEFKTSQEEPQFKTGYTQSETGICPPWYHSGLKIFKGQENSKFSDGRKPVLDSMVPCDESRTRINETDTRVRLTFPCDPSQSYEVWYYLPDSISFISVQNVELKELLYCRNHSNRTPQFSFLSTTKMNKSTDPRDQIAQTKKASDLFKTKFPPFHMSPFHSISMAGKKSKAQKNLDSCILHHSIKNDAPIKVIQTIVGLNPKALVEVDEHGQTPIHTALLHSKTKVSLDLVKSVLLVTPGENACRFKDSTGRLPLHIAAEYGLNIEILRALVDAYADGCYRQNKENDLPLHLLERSGKANVASLELLIRPIMGNESICRVEGSKGCDLPLHIAARYRCSYEVLEKLLRTYADAAGRNCMRREYKDKTALYMFEEGKTLTASNGTETKRDSDFHQRSDLIFAYDPMLSPPSKNVTENGNKDGSDIRSTQSTITPFRHDKQRILRLANLIMKEATEVSDGHIVGGKKKLEICDAARLSWAWMTTYENKEEEEDYYETVELILNKLSSPALKVLAFVEWNGKVIKDCALPKCKQLIINRIRFVGRYEWSELEFPLHKSDTCLIMRAKDHYAVEEYKKMKKILEDNAAAILEDGGDDFSIDQDAGIPLQSFVRFCQILGLSEREAKQELRKKHKQSGHDNSSGESPQEDAIFGLRCIQETNEEQYEEEELDAFYIEDEQKINATTFDNFCKSHGIDEKGVRRVVIKFMLYQQQFEREKTTRERLKLRGSDWPVVPILEDYNADRMEYSSKDALYAKDIQDKDESTHDMFRYKYALVLVGADRDLGEISVHESPGILQIREYMMGVGTALQTLHRNSVIHGDLRLSNIVRFHSQFALIDLDSSYCQSSNKNVGKDINYFGGSSHKFSSGLIPPEMIVKVDPSTHQVLLDRYEFYWKSVSEDARDLDLLTPDDICNIASVVKSIAMTQGNFSLTNGTLSTTSEDILNSAQSLSISAHSSNGMPNGISLGDKQDWKHMISMALITISFSDLPHSLTSCNSISEFSDVWNKLLSNAELWKQVRPRVCSDGNVYLVKAYHQADSEVHTNFNNTSQLPYNLVEASEKLDIWAFGVLIFAMCAKGQLFSLDHDDNLVESDSFSLLYKWDKKIAQKVIEERIHDPLAQDLLLQILVPEHERLETMDMVLNHPFFGPSSGLEAQRILEKHEEQQLMYEETAVITQMTSETLVRIENSTESQCKLIFEEEKIVVPTSLVILPYELEFNEETGTPTAPNDPQTLDLAIEIGKHLLEINMTTARLSFWLMMKKKIAGNGSDSFKTKMKEWLKRARNDSVDVVAKEIVNEIGSGDEYMYICREILDKGDAITNARKYIKDPMGTASAEIHKNIESLVQCYSSHLQYLYLVDEYHGVPAAPDDVSRTNFYRDEGNEEGSVYPIKLDPDTKHFQNLFLPFLNITVMSVTAIDGLESLANLLGLSTSHGIPGSWIDTSDGLIHKSSQPSSVAEFAVLQDLIRKQNFHTPLPGKLSSLRSMESSRTGFSEWDETLVEVGSEMMQLEIFFREYDPLRIFSALRRVTGPQRNGYAIWTTEDVVRKILEEIEQAKIEIKLKHLKHEYYQSHGFMDEIIALNKQLHKIRSKAPEMEKPPVNDVVTVASVTSTTASQKRNKTRNTAVAKINRGCTDFFLGRSKKA